MWWTLRPARFVTCSVMPALVANDDTACSASCGSNAGLAERQALGQLDVPGHEGAPRQIESDLDQRLVERVQPTGEATHAGLVPDRFGERLAERDGNVLDRVVGVDVQVAGRRDHEIEPAVTAELVEHVVVERDTGRHLRGARAVEVDRDVDRRLLGHPCPRRDAARSRPHPHNPVTLQCELDRRQEPVVLRRQPDRDPKATVEVRPSAAVADQHTRVDHALPDLASIVFEQAHEDEVGPGREHLDAQVATAPRSRDRAPPPVCSPVAPCRARGAAPADRRAAWPRRGGRARRPCPAARRATMDRRGNRAWSPPCSTSSRTSAPPPGGLRRRRDRVPTMSRTRRRPRRRRRGRLDAARTASSTAGDSITPVGLFGEHRNVTAGSWAATWAAASTGSSVKSSRRPPATTVAPVIRAMWACNLVGRLEHRDRRGQARRTQAGASGCTSLDPFAANTFAARRRGMRRCRSAAPTRRPVGVAVPRDVRELGRELIQPRGGRGERRLVRVQPDVDIDLGRVVAGQRGEVIAHRRTGSRAPTIHGWRR